MEVKKERLWIPSVVIGLLSIIIIGATWRADVFQITSGSHAGGYVKNNTSGVMLPDQAILDADIPATIARDSELHSAVTLTGQNYLGLTGQQITANPINLGSSHVTGIIADGSIPATIARVTALAAYLNKVQAEAQTVNSDLTLSNTTHESISVLAQGTTVITNGTFDSPSNWTAGASGWGIGGGVASFETDGGPFVASLSQSGSQLGGTITNGVSYTVEFDYNISVNISGLLVSLNGTSGPTISSETSAHYSAVIVAGASGGLVITSNDSEGYIDNVVVAQNTGNTIINGAGLATTNATMSGGVSVGTSGAAAGQVLAQKLTATNTVAGGSLTGTDAVITNATMTGAKVGGSTGHSYNLSSGLVRHFKLNDNAGENVVADYSDNGSEATASVDTDQLSMTGKGGALARCFDFNGTSEYFTIDDSNELDFTTAFSASFWVYHATAFGADTYLDKLVGTQRSFRIDVNATVWTVYLSTNGTGTTIRYDFTHGMVVNTWYHVTFTYDSARPAGDRVRAYRNGVMLSPTVTTEGNGSLFASTTAITVGAIAGPSALLAGRMDDLRLYNRAIGNTEVVELYNRGTGLETYPSGSIALDVNGKGYFDDTVYAKEFLTWSDPATKIIVDRKVPDITASSLGAATISYKFKPSIIGYTTKTVEVPRDDGKGTTTAIEYTPVYDDAAKQPENFGFDALQLPEPLRRYVDGKWMINWPGVVALQADHNAKQQQLIEELQYRVDVLEVGNVAILERLAKLENTKVEVR